ncbi:uncharacterized protein LOC110117572 [Ceratitis capitata]|uniref:uncharacterized protein LOC110117572 n=1 Tax=Ceratitis capitata TaxID=7213 RepID=UPI000329D2DC|nr:uncharacterized protein LOC110117572 [Ceratitis capitata]
MLTSCSCLGRPQTDVPSRILGLFVTYSKSHMLVYCTVAEHLARVGHNVTVIGIIENVYPNANYKYLHLQLPKGDRLDNNALRRVINRRHSFIQSLIVTTREYMRMANASLWQPEMREYLRDRQAGAYDLLLFGYVMNEFQMGLAAHFQCPIVVLWVVQPALQVNRFVGNSVEPNYVPTLTSRLQQPLNFMGRLKNYINALLEELLVLYLDYCAGQLYM